MWILHVLTSINASYARCSWSQPAVTFFQMVPGVAGVNAPTWPEHCTHFDEQFTPFFAMMSVAGAASSSELNASSCSMDSSFGSKCFTISAASFSDTLTALFALWCPFSPWFPLVALDDGRLRANACFAISRHRLVRVVCVPFVSVFVLILLLLLLMTFMLFNCCTLGLVCCCGCWPSEERGPHSLTGLIFAVTTAAALVQLLSYWLVCKINMIHESFS